MKRLFSICVWAVILVVLPLRAEIPYSCSFEESEDLSNWVMNYGASKTDKWMIGTAVHSEGKRAMYISSDGINPVYGSKPNIVISYLRFKFPTATKQQNYDLSFDWKCAGSEATSRLYVMVCPESKLSDASALNYYNLDNILANPNAIISDKVVDNACQQLGKTGQRYLCGSEEWKNVSLTREIKVSPTFSQETFAIVFIWVNNNTDKNLVETSICIDNLQIGSATLKKPDNVKATPICEDSTMLVSWESGQNEFEVQYREVGKDTWRRADGLTDGVDGFTRTNGIYCSYSLQRIMEGSYDVRVKGVSDTLESNYTYDNQVLVYCPDNHCVNYLDLDNPNLVCTYGFNEEYRSGESPYDNIGYINMGPDAQESRHTIHTDPTETDPRTAGVLHTVPVGAIGAVRLGNWKSGGEAESMTYSITVDSANQGVLIVKYAVVLEDPSHEAKQNKFTLEILDSLGNQIDELCGKADFTYHDAVEADWNIATKKETGASSDVAWKDWTSVGINLQPYNGQTVRVRLTTRDCGQAGHYGYAYFTIDCANAYIETENCGSDSKITCYAPDGFAYKWSDENGKVVSNSQQLVVDPGLHTYTCRVSFIEDTTCYFEVSTVSAPRFPVPEYTVTPVYGECTSKLRFTNTSHVMNKYSGVETHTHEPVQDCHWYFTRLSDRVTTESYNWSPLYTCPSHRDTIVVNYTCYIGENNVCDSSRVDTIIVPDIIPEDTEFHISTCYNEPVQFGGQWFDKDTVFVGVYPNFAGCDSVSTLYLEVFERPDDVYRHDSICSDSSIVIDGLTFNEPMTNKPFILKTAHGCDSVVYVTLTVNPRIDVDVDSLAYACADGISFPIPYDVLVGQYDSLQIQFNAPGLRDTTIYDPSVTNVVIPYSANILPGHYIATLRFHQYRCGIRTEERPFDIRYSSNVVITQRWNDVLAVGNADYNGGFAFDSVQWYLNDQPIEGATNFNYYAGSGNKLQFGQEYTALLVRSDGVKLFTCPFIPVEVPAEIADMPTLIPLSSPMHIRGKGTAYWYDILGRVYSSSTYNNSDIIAPAVLGCYLLVLQGDEGRTVHQIMVR